MKTTAYSCPNCLGFLPTCPAFGIEWKCPACHRVYLALRSADGQPMALDADRGVFSWVEPDYPLLIQKLVPEWMERCRGKLGLAP